MRWMRAAVVVAAVVVLGGCTDDGLSGPEFRAMDDEGEMTCIGTVPERSSSPSLVA